MIGDRPPAFVTYRWPLPPISAYAKFLCVLFVANHDGKLLVAAVFCHRTVVCENAGTEKARRPIRPSNKNLFICSSLCVLVDIFFHTTTALSEFAALKIQTQFVARPRNPCLEQTSGPQEDLFPGKDRGSQCHQVSDERSSQHAQPWSRGNILQKNV